jgi:hypothetical protein
MVGCDQDSIRNLKFLLYFFEWMPGLKMNFHKSGVVVIGVDNDITQLQARGPLMR